jgi:hypothetical protein
MKLLVGNDKQVLNRLFSKGMLTCLLYVSHDTFAASANDTQTLSITIPLVALIDVEEVSPSFTFIAPTDAGDGFNTAIAINQTANVAISSNNSNAKLNAKLDTDLSAFGLSVELTELSGNLGSCTADLSLATSDKTLCDLGMKQTSNGQVQVQAKMLNPSSMLPYGNYTANIVYTITEN